jgi:carboxyl-terminal processing protease
MRDGRSGASLAFLPRSPAADGWETVVVAVEPGSAAETAGLEPGMRVVRIDGRDPATRLPAGDGLERYERAAIAMAAASGEPGASAGWTVTTSDDAEPRELTVAYRRDERPQVKFGTLPAMPTELTWRHLDETERERWGAGNHEIGLIGFNIWLIPVARPFDLAMDTLRTADGIVIDLRGNPGGIGAMAMGIAGHFTDAPEDLGEMRTRDTAMRFATNPRRTTADGKPTAPYAGPLAILVDEGTASTSEIFAGGLQHLGRAKVFGARTAGAALPAIMTPLPNGDVFLHAIADYRLPDGTALEATGVKPDNARPYDRADYAREGDPALAEAVRWIASQPARRKTEAP